MTTHGVITGLTILLAGCLLASSAPSDSIGYYERDLDKRGGFDKTLSSDSFGFRKRVAFDRLNSGGFGLAKRGRLDRVLGSGFGMSKRTFDRLNGAFGMRKRTLDRINGVFGMRKRGLDRLNGLFGGL